jgi:glycosyltransferase involved in cell wall biosynthesis
VSNPTYTEAASAGRPLVSVICLCYNHELFVEEALRSVKAQTYPNIQLIVVDDRSTDGSVGIIGSVLKEIPDAQFLSHSANLGNCRAFNRGFEKATGEFIIDFSADDVLRGDRVQKGVEALQSTDPATGVQFSDAELIDEKGKQLGFHSDRFPHATVPQGDIYEVVLQKYFINSPTMMMRRQVFEKLGGYDESLAYEDFDFWVRSARDFKYVYSPEALVKRRIVAASLSRKQYRHGSAQLRSTLKVCEKALILNRTGSEHKALKKRIRFEVRKAISLGELRLAGDYWKLLKQIP